MPKLFTTNLLAKYRINNKTKPPKQSPKAFWNLINRNIILSKLDTI